MHSKNLADEKYQALRDLFPNAITETMDEDGNVVRAIDKDILMQEISTQVVEGKEERYQFTWPDKKKAILNANAPINKTLRPCREESVNFDETENLYIEGDNLEVLKLLQETYLGKIKMIYIDPPYNTGKDFVYNDNFKESVNGYLEDSGQYDEEGNRLEKNLEKNGRFHTDWLNMMYPRLKLARDLLSDDGVVFISIDDNEVDNLKKMCDEIFGIINYSGTLVINSTPNARDYGHVGKMHEYCLLYSKNNNIAKTYKLKDKNKTFKYSDEIGEFNIHPLYNSNEAFHKNNRPNLYYPFYIYTDKESKVGEDFYKIGLEKNENCIEVYPPKSLKNEVQFVWRWGRDKSLKFLNKEIIGYKDSNGEYRIVQKMRHSEKIVRSLLTDKKYSSRRGTSEVEELLSGKIFSFPKPIELISDFIKVGLARDDLFLDLFSGSSTSAHSIMKLNSEDNGNRKYIMVQLPEETDEKSEAYTAGYKTIAEIGKERIRRAGKQILEENKDKEGIENLDLGFRVLKTDSSNMKDVYYSPAATEQSFLDELEDNIKEDRTSEDLLFQVMLDLGVSLSSKIESEDIDGKEVFVVEDGFLIACFDKDVSEDTVKEIANKEPYYAVLRDRCMASDSVAANFDQIFASISPETIRRVI